MTGEQEESVQLDHAGFKVFSIHQHGCERWWLFNITQPLEGMWVKLKTMFHYELPDQSYVYPYSNKRLLPFMVEYTHTPTCGNLRDANVTILKDNTPIMSYN